MPTKTDLEELRNECTRTWTTQNGVKGSKMTGPNGNSIFLPAVGYHEGTSLINDGGYGPYWSSTPYNAVGYYGYGYAYGLSVGSSGSAYVGPGFNREDGLTVRPVSD